jgi:hypothetical protein
VHYLLCLAVASYGDGEVEVFGEPGDRAGGYGQAADECPPYSDRVQVGD